MKNIKHQLDDFFDRAKFDDLNTVIEEAKRRFVQNALEQNNYSLHLTAKNLGYRSVSSTILTLFELEKDYLKASHLRDFFEEDYSPQPHPNRSEEDIISSLAQCQNRDEFDSQSDAIEKAFFKRALIKHDGNFTLAAQSIDAGRKTVSRKVKKHNIEIQPTKDDIKEPSIEINESSLTLMGNAVATTAENYPDLKTAYELVKREAMINAILEHDYNIANASKSLGWTRATYRQNYATLFEHEKFDISTIENDKALLEERIAKQKTNIQEALSLFRRHKHSMPQMTALFESAKKHAIKTALSNNDNNIAKTAQQIGLERSTIAHHLKKYDAPKQDTKKPHITPENNGSNINNAIAKTLGNKTFQAQTQQHDGFATNQQHPKATVKKRDTAPCTKTKTVPNQSSNTSTKAAEKPQERHDFKTKSQILSFLVMHFKYNELRELRTETAKAMIATSLKENNFDVEQSAQQLGLDRKTFVNGLRNYFNIQIGAELSNNIIEQRLNRETEKLKHKSTVRDILPEISSHKELSHLFAEAQKDVIINSWNENERNVAITANDLGISDDAVIKVLPKIDLD